jgi:hypothetical protein
VGKQTEIFDTLGGFTDRHRVCAVTVFYVARKAAQDFCGNFNLKQQNDLTENYHGRTEPLARHSDKRVIVSSQRSSSPTGNNLYERAEKVAKEETNLYVQYAYLFTRL